MPRFFLTDGSITPDAASATLTGDDARHIALALRMAVGEEITLADGQGFEYRARLSAITPTEVTADILSAERSRSELAFPIHLYMGYPKGDKFELVIEKAVELGVASITPFISSRCIRRPAAEKTDRLSERYNKIARSAAGQCGRALLPTVQAPLSFDDMLKRATESSFALFCYEGDGVRQIGDLLPTLPYPASVAVIVGAEGGFSPEEAADACRAGCIPTGLGRRILRCETAPLAALSCLDFYYDFRQND